MYGSFSQKSIQLAITLGKGTFSGAGNTKVIEGLACEVSITKPGQPDKNSADIKIWGLKYEDMAQLTMLSFRPGESHHNIITIMAGERRREDGMGVHLPLAFQGEIRSAYADFNAAPNVCMQFNAATGYYPQQIALPTSTINGEVPAAMLFENFAGEAGYTYKNEGVSASVTNACFHGSPISKMSKLARDIDCELIVDDGMVVTLPSGKARWGKSILISKDTGLIGYPTFTENGIACTCLYNPNLLYGGLIKVESIVPRASGLWRINKLTHSLSAYTPGAGSWESQIEAVYYE